MMDNIPRFKQESLDFFVKHKDKLEGVDSVIHEMQKPLKTKTKESPQRSSIITIHMVL